MAGLLSRGRADRAAKFRKPAWEVTPGALLAGLPAVLRALLRLLRQGAKDRKGWLPAALGLLPGGDGRVCLQLHHPLEKVRLLRFPPYARDGMSDRSLVGDVYGSAVAVPILQMRRPRLKEICSF